MREIKFRGKRIDNGEWVYGFLYISNISGCYILQCVSFAKKTKEGMNLGDKVVEFEVNPGTVGQYTGKYTDDGIEVYEGDLLVSNNNLILIKWVGHGFFPFRRKNSEEFNKITNWGQVYKSEVIGNIHDNPELLGGAE